MTDRFFARSASDRTDDWPHWFVADRQNGEINVTIRLIEKRFGVALPLLPFLWREACEAMAAQANSEGWDA